MTAQFCPVCEKVLGFDNKPHQKCLENAKTLPILPSGVRVADGLIWRNCWCGNTLTMPEVSDE